MRRAAPKNFGDVVAMEKISKIDPIHWAKRDRFLPSPPDLTEKRVNFAPFLVT